MEPRDPLASLHNRRQRVRGRQRAQSSSKLGNGEVQLDVRWENVRMKVEGGCRSRAEAPYHHPASQALRVAKTVSYCYRLGLSELSLSYWAVPYRQSLLHVWHHQSHVESSDEFVGHAARRRRQAC